MNWVKSKVSITYWLEEKGSYIAFILVEGKEFVAYVGTRKSKHLGIFNKLNKAKEAILNELGE